MIGELAWADRDVEGAELPQKSSWRRLGLGDALRTGDTFRTSEEATVRLEFAWMAVAPRPLHHAHDSREHRAVDRAGAGEGRVRRAGPRHREDPRGRRRGARGRPPRAAPVRRAHERFGARGELPRARRWTRGRDQGGRGNGGGGRAAPGRAGAPPGRPARPSSRKGPRLRALRAAGGAALDGGRPVAPRRDPRPGEGRRAARARRGGAAAAPRDPLARDLPLAGLRARRARRREPSSAEVSICSVDR